MATLRTPAPYITPEILRNSVTGISWQTIPARNSTAAQQEAEQWNICQRASAMVDAEVNQRIRATVSTETFLGPDYRVTVRGSTNAVNVILSRKPILEVTAGQWAYANPPLTWSAIPADAFVVNQPSPGIYAGVPGIGDAGESGQSVTLGGGYITWWNGRNGMFLKISYVSGYPHCILTQDAPAGSTALTVDDCTGWYPSTLPPPGASGIVYDAGDEETIECIGTSVTAGAGSLLLGAPTAFEHQAGTLISTLPAQLMQATILFAISQAIVRGATATGTQSLTGTAIHGDAPEVFASEAELLCKPYARVT